ncbi:MAG: hypothetical protein GC162_00615 [Planctomycetes bacterium]|nr:hypothetical protein [Planctomycetota bacterium]
MRIDILYFEGCPNHEPTVQCVRRIARRLGIEAPVHEVEVTPSDDPAALKFLGSPTVLIDGRDIDPACREGASYGFGCRTFAGIGMPDDTLIEQAIREALGGGAGRSPVAARDRSTLYCLGAAATAVLSSACCWLPLVLLAFGVTLGGVAGFFESVRSFFLLAAAIFLGAGFYFTYFRRSVCKPGEACATPNPKLQRFNRSMLWVATVFVIAFALFPYYSPMLIRTFNGGDSAAPPDAATPQATVLATYRFRVEGMTCTGCAAGLEARLGRLPGIASAEVSFDVSEAVVRADPGWFDPAAVVNTVQTAGFKAISIPQAPAAAAKR